MPFTTGYSRAHPRQRSAPSRSSSPSTRSRFEISSENSSSPRSDRLRHAGQISGSRSGRSSRVSLPHLREQLLRRGIIGPHQEHIAHHPLRLAARTAVLLLLPSLPLLARVTEESLHLGPQLAGAVGVEERRARFSAGRRVAHLEGMGCALPVAV